MSGGTAALPLCCLSDSFSEILLFIEATDYRSNFAKTILFTGVVDEINHKIISDFNPPSTINRNSL